MMYDIKSNKFYNTNFSKDVLVDYSVKTFGYAQAEYLEKLKASITKLSDELPEKLISDFELAQKALERFEAPDNPVIINLEKE